MTRITILLLAGAALAAGCGGDVEQAAPPAQASQTPAATASATATATAEERDAEPKERPGTRVVIGDSRFGDMLFDAKGQAIYVFELDGEDETVCYGECAEAWPPVLTKGEPRAGDGAKASLLGTIEREDGSTQVTYAGLPLYYYAHEAPGEVECHDVTLNGGKWWVVGADGAPLV